MTARPMIRQSEWAVIPLDAGGAANALGISKRTLDEALKSWPYFERRGRKRVFYPEHIELLRKEMNECGSRSSGKTDGHMFTGLALMASGSDALSKLATLSRQRRLARN